MKLFASILSIYVLFVALMPCCCDDERVDVCGHSIEQQATDTDAHSHSDCSGTCLPFCLCHSCSGFSIFSLLSYDFRLKQETVRNCYCFPPQNYSLLVFNCIWQPPKV